MSRPIKPTLARQLIRSVKDNFELVWHELHRVRRLRARVVPIRKYLDTHSTRCLHIGAGGNVLSGWLNTDLEPQTPDILYLDVSDALPFNENSLNFIFSEHLIEHLPHHLGVFHLRECFRVLKPGGRVRIATPDLQFLIDIQTTVNHTETQAKYIQRTIDQGFQETGFYSGGFVVNYFMRHWGHQFIYDEQTLTGTLARAGFSAVRRWAVGESDEPELQRIEHHGDAISDEFNRMQTIVVEGTK